MKKLYDESMRFTIPIFYDDLVFQLGRQLKRPKYHTIQIETQLKQHDIPKNI